MAVIGLLLGASAMTSRMLEERRQLKDELARMERVSDAVVGYALRNRTRERVIKFVTRELPHAEWAFHLPAGRPYLPCPDWDGDGYEDRWPGGANGFVQGMEIKPDLTVTATIGVIRRPFTRSPLTWIALQEAGTWVPLNEFGEWGEWLPYGECRVAKGAVPWRTLGVEPSDGWGNRHTYFADPVFSNAIFGFDRQTIADGYDPPRSRHAGQGDFAPCAQRRRRMSRVDMRWRALGRIRVRPSRGNMRLGRRESSQPQRPCQSGF